MMSKRVFLYLVVFILSIVVTIVLTRMNTVKEMSIYYSNLDTESSMTDLMFLHNNLTEELEYARSMHVFYDIANLNDKKNLDDYVGWCDNIEDNYNQILIKTIEELKLLENTYIFFMSDNGWMLGEHGFIGLNKFYEPLI